MSINRASNLSVSQLLGCAVFVNTFIFCGEMLAGYLANSLMLSVDALHNFSDELALICLYLSFGLAVRASRKFEVVANVLNSLGIATIAILILICSFNRLGSPEPVIGWVPIMVGTMAAIGNWIVARALKATKLDHASIRLAYLHNMGDVMLCISTALSGILIMYFSAFRLDALVASAIALFLIVGVVREIVGPSENLFQISGAEAIPSASKTAAVQAK